MKDESKTEHVVGDVLTEAELAKVAGGGDEPPADPKPEQGKATPILF